MYDVGAACGSSSCEEDKGGLVRWYERTRTRTRTRNRQRERQGRSPKAATGRSECPIVPREIEENGENGGLAAAAASFLLRVLTVGVNVGIARLSASVSVSLSLSFLSFLFLMHFLVRSRKRVRSTQSPRKPNKRILSHPHIKRSRFHNTLHRLPKSRTVGDACAYPAADACIAAAKLGAVGLASGLPSGSPPD
ncbi:hypothetical protein B0H13DRAFT_2097458, partial [Mycena leptocephala]